MKDMFRQRRSRAFTACFIVHKTHLTGYSLLTIDLLYTLHGLYYRTLNICIPSFIGLSRDTDSPSKAMPQAYVLLHLSNDSGIPPRIHSRNAAATAQPATVPDLTWTPFTAMDPLTNKFIQVDVGLLVAEKSCLVEEDSRGAFLSSGEADGAMQTSVEKVVVEKLRDREKVRLEWGYASIRRGRGVWAWIEGNEMSEEPWHWWEVVRVDVA